MPPIRLGPELVTKLHLGGVSVRRAYLGSELVFDSAPPGDPAGPKIDPTHYLVTSTTNLVRLTDGQLEGMTGDANTTIVDNAFASAVAGTVTFAKETLAAVPQTMARWGGLVKVDKTSGRYSYVGFSTVANPTATSGTVEIGHLAGTGLVVRSQGSVMTYSHTVVAEANLVDGAWYWVGATWDLALTHSSKQAQVLGAANPETGTLDPTLFPVAGNGNITKMATSYKPYAIVARTNSALGTIRSFAFHDHFFGTTVAGTNEPLNLHLQMGDGTDTQDTGFIYSAGKSAPLRIIITAGGSGVYGGKDWYGHARTGHPYTAFRKMWRELADLGYTVVHTHALHEGWGADDHLTKQLELYNKIVALAGPDTRLYYLGYSMGGASVWRALMGRAAFPSIRAAYLVAGISNIGMFYDNASFPNIKTRWPGGAASIDEPQSWTTEQLVARGTKVRMVTSTADANVPKETHHDPMFAKFAGSGLASELVHQGIDHFHPDYWNAQDAVNFFEGADL